MFLKIKSRIEKELSNYIKSVEKLYNLNSISPVLFKSIKNFISRKGKRVRPILFVIGYLGFAKKAAPGLYRSAVSMELLHDFMLVHDDIIDKSATRRGSPSMHTLLNTYLSDYNNIKVSGEDLTIVAGDIMYAMALDAFLFIKEDKERKEAALKKLIAAAFYTGSGEFIELLTGIKTIDRVSQGDIYKIYDLKTANYTFASPLTIGAILAGTKKKEIDRLFQYGLHLGRAFQIKDDILGMFSAEKETGKSNLSDLKEAKKTILIWHAYNHSGNNTKSLIKEILSKQNIGQADLLRMRQIITEAGSLDYAKNLINNLFDKAQTLHALSRMRLPYKEALQEYAQRILEL